jgi:hypothetical protein
MPAALKAPIVSSRRGRGGARFHHPRKLRIEGGERHRRRGEAQLRHRCEDVDVALDQRRFGDDPDGMIAGGQDLKDRAGDAQLLLERLVGVGVRAHRDHRRPVAGLGQLLLQELGRVRLHQDARLEIEAWR